MRILVTGHHGYLGSVLTPFLQAAGHQVTGLDVDYFADCLLGPPPPEVPGRRLDLRDVRPEDLAGFDAVCHLAALCNDPLGDLNPALTYEVNHRATVGLARAAKLAGVTRFVFSSSCSLYGAGARDDDGTDDGSGALGRAEDTALLTEDAPFAPVTPYGESKIRAERDLAALADDDFSPVFARNATAYGFSPRLRGDLVVNDLTAQALLTGEVRLRSDGSAWRPLVHVRDIAAAFLALLTAPRERIHARAFNIGTSTGNHRVRDVAELVAEVVGAARVTYAPGAGPDRRDYRVNCDRLSRELPGFQPRWTLRQGIAELVANYQRYGLTRAELTGPRHQRLGRIHALREAGLLDARLRWTGVPARSADAGHEHRLAGAGPA